MNSDGILSGSGAISSFNIESTFSTSSLSHIHLENDSLPTALQSEAIASSLEALEDHGNVFLEHLH